MFEQFPKERVPLSEELAEIYNSEYVSNRTGSSKATSVTKRLESWLHRQVAADVIDRDRRLAEDPATLEIGAGTLNHLEYEPVGSRYDVVEPFTMLWEGSPNLSAVRKVYTDIAEIPRGERYDRIISVATFEHICNLPEVVALCGVLLEDGGTLRVAIPSEGTILWTLGWKLTTGLEFRLKSGLDYGELMRHEHVNTAKEIEEVLGHFFGEVDAQVFGVSKPLSLYQFFACSAPDLDRCRTALPESSELVSRPADSVKYHIGRG